VNTRLNNTQIVLYIITLLSSIESIDLELNVVCVARWTNIKVQYVFSYFPSLYFACHFVFICTNLEVSQTIYVQLVLMHGTCLLYRNKVKYAIGDKEGYKEWKSCM